MTILELCFDIDKTTDFESYDKDYDYWSVDENGTYLFLTYRTNADSLIGTSEVNSCDIDAYIEYIWETGWTEKPLFIPYEELKPYEKIVIEFETGVRYESMQKYPLICVRGTCDRQCGKKDIKPYCFHQIPCYNNRPDWNCYSCKYPNFFDLVFSVIDWMKECGGVNALVMMFEFQPTEFERDLDFRYCTALLVHHNSIRVIKDAEKIYSEYNEKYPTEDRQIEASISDLENNFVFKF